jgi:signal transduction histidine kinase
MNYDELTLLGFGISPSGTDSRFDKITALASQTLNTPISLLSVIDDAGDRQLLKSSVGMNDDVARPLSTPLSHSFCKHVRDSGEPLILADAREHPLHMHNPAIQGFGVVSYIGIPFHGERGEPIGALCCIDQRPREWSDREEQILMQLASIADDQFQLSFLVRDRAKAKLLAEQAAVTRTNFLSHANHEFRTPLSAIYGAAHLLGTLSVDKKALSLVKIIERNTSRLRSLTDDLVRIAELDNGTAIIEKESYDFIEVVENVVKTHRDAAQSKGIGLTFSDQTKGNTTFLMDFAIMTNVIDRLVSNAIKFTTVGEVQITIETTPAGEAIILRTSDTGVGIGTSLKTRIFYEFEGHEPNTSREGGGTGIGMNIIKREIDLLGGSISVSSQSGEGTAFTICLPTGRGSKTSSLAEIDKQGDRHLLTCLECGAKLGLLRRHLTNQHGMTPEVYRAKWALPENFELSSSAYRNMRKNRIP